MQRENPTTYWASIMLMLSKASLDYGGEREREREREGERMSLANRWGFRLVKKKRKARHDWGELASGEILWWAAIIYHYIQFLAWWSTVMFQSSKKKNTKKIEISLQLRYSDYWVMVYTTDNDPHQEKSM